MSDSCIYALIWRMLLIAMNAEDLFGSLIAIGFMTHIAVQVFINIAVVTNTIPPTGIPPSVYQLRRKLDSGYYGGNGNCAFHLQENTVIKG